MSSEFQNWLRTKYLTPQALSAAWRLPIADFEHVQPPPSAQQVLPDHLVPLLDQLEFSDSRRPPAFGVTDYLAAPDSPAKPPDSLRELYYHVRIAARERIASGRAFSPAGVCPALSVDADPQWRAFADRSAFMHGASAALPTSAPHASAARDPLAELLLAHDWRADRKVLLLYPHLYAQILRLAARAAAYPIRATGPHRMPLDGPALLRRALDLVTRAKLAFALSDSRLPYEQLRQYAVTICPTLELLAADDMAKFDAYVHAGGFLAFGPRIPFIDETFDRNETLARHFGGVLSYFELAIRPCGDGAFVTLPSRLWPENIEFIAFEAGLARGLVADSEALDSAVHRAGNRRLVFIANVHDRPIKTAVSGEPFSCLRNVDTGEEIAADSTNRLSAPPEAVTVWEVM